EEGADNSLYDIFPMSDVEPREDEIDTQLIESLAKRNVLSEEALNGMLTAHGEFLEAGGDDGRFEQLYTASLPMNLYMTSVKVGKQFKPGMNTLPTDFSFADEDLRASEFTGCIADGVDFNGADLTGSLFTNGFFRGANFEDADLTDVDFTGSDLTGANFRDAELTGADFEIANCTNADFTGANTTDATFKGANITDVKY
ncbi:MAG: pentapeptide repeat-containing protein, partial [Sphingobacteriaceae bacterium]